jgi:hypothetical protein
MNGKQVTQGRSDKTQPNVFSADETADVGLDNQTPVAEGIGIGRDEPRFNGKDHQGGGCEVKVTGPNTLASVENER